MLGAFVLGQGRLEGTRAVWHHRNIPLRKWMSSLEEGVEQFRSSWLSLSHSPALLLPGPSDILASILFFLTRCVFFLERLSLSVFRTHLPKDCPIQPAYLCRSMLFPLRAEASQPARTEKPGPVR